jgi:uncharacterized membrane protein (UPF0127 family)
MPRPQSCRYFAGHVRVQLPHKYSRAGNLTGRKHRAIGKLVRAVHSFPVSSTEIKMRIIKRHLVFATIAMLIASTVWSARADPLVTYPLRIKKHEIRAEVAGNEQDRLQGLMFRDRLAENSGMIFLYPRAEATAMWMKNTRIALSVAFIDAKGRILNIADMEPYSEEAHASSGAAAYALEMNRGWFKKLGIRAGAVVEGLKALPPAQ